MFVVDGIDLTEKVKKSINWINSYSIPREGIAICSGVNPLVSYPEVTGYYIPTLLKYQLKNIALSYANYLVSIQNSNGSWNEPSGKYEYTFDTGMILKGLIALIEEGLDVDGSFLSATKKAASWIMSMQRDDGSISTPNDSMWKLPYDKKVPESIHIYFLDTFVKLAEITKNEQYVKFVQKAKCFYLAKVDLCDFSILSHFNAYIIEGLIDIGEIDKAKRAMDLISLHQRFDGSISAYSFVDFVCSTGLLQYAICWFKLGCFERGQKALIYVANLQNLSGGWYGSYKVSRDIPNYYPSSEISWAVKYFLDAVYYGNDYMKLLNGNDSAVFENTESNSVANLTEELVKETIERFKNKGINNIYLYGAGEVCLNMIPFLEKESINIVEIFDRSAENKDIYIKSYKVEAFSPDKIKKDSIVLISSLGSKYKIRKFLRNESNKFSLNLQIEILKKKNKDYLKIYK